MKKYFKLSRYGIDLYPAKDAKTGNMWLDNKGNPYYLYYIYFLPNFLSKKNRYFGYEVITYDCQNHASFGFWFFNFSWSLPWTTEEK